MSVAIWIIAVIAIVAIAAAGLMMWKLRHTRELRTRFGPEYDHLLTQRGNARRVEQELDSRAKRVEKLHLRPLTKEESERFAAEWQTAQARFVDDPRGAVARADALVRRTMELRGYPMGDFDERVADLSVDHAPVVDHYRTAHDIAERDAHGTASTEDLRLAMQHYRALFEDLMQQRAFELGEVRR
jgi:hypothetical protein